MKCPVVLPNPKNPAYGTACNGKREIQGKGADAVLFCPKCRATWTMDSKEE